MKLTIDVSSKTFIRFFFTIIGIAVLGFLFWKLWPSLLLIFVAFILAVALNKPVSSLADRLPGEGRVAATGIAYMVVLIFVGIFVYIAVPPTIEQTGRFIDYLPQQVEDLTSNRGALSDVINQYGLQSQIQQIAVSAKEQSASLAQGVGSSIVVGVSSILNGAFTLITVLVLTFLMLIEGPKWQQKFWNLYTSDEMLERHQVMSEQMYKVVSGYVNGQVAVASIAATLGLVVLLALTLFFGLPLTIIIPLAVVIFVTDMIPMIGALIGALIVMLVLVLNVPIAALVFLLYYLVYQQIENNLIQPVIQAKSVSLSALTIFVALIIGIALLGIAGGILAIPVAGCIRVVILDYIEHREHKAKARTAKSLFKKVFAAEV